MKSGTPGSPPLRLELPHVLHQPGNAKREAAIIGHTRRSQTMKTRIWLAVGAGALLSLSAVGQTAPEVTLTRIECGTGAKPTNVAERLAEVKVRPEQVKYVGISHFHADHTGQLSPFANATLLIGKGDWDGITAIPPMQ